MSYSSQACGNSTSNKKKRERLEEKKMEEKNEGESPMAVPSLWVGKEQFNLKIQESRKEHLTYVN